MKFILTVIWLILFAGQYWFQELPLRLKFYSPKFAITNNEFQINALVKCDYSQLDSAQLQFSAPANLELDSVKFISADTSALLPWHEDYFVDFNRKGYSIILNMQEPAIQKLPYLQFAFYVKSSSVETESYDFNYRLKYKNDFLPLEKKDFVNLKAKEIKFYKPSFVSGKALELTPNSSVSFPLPNSDKEQNIVLQFWLKLQNGFSARFFLTNPPLNDTLCSFGILPRGLANYKFDEGLIIFDDFAFSLNSWYKFTAVFQRNERLLYLFLNNEPLIEKQINASNLEVTLKSIASNLYLDNLKAVEFNGGINQLLDGESKLKTLPDSLRTIYFNDFEAGSSSLNSLLKITNGKFAQSDAPEFLPNPTLDIQIYSTYYLLEWQSPPSAKPLKFVLQKSKDGKNFENIYVLEATGVDKSEKMQFTSEKPELNSVVYFRVKEINIDSTEAYSNLIKVGQGEIEEFSLQQNYPNPFNPVTTITLDVYVAGSYTINVYDLVGKKISTIYSGDLSVGKHRFSFDGSDYPSGIYFYEVVSPNYSKIMKMILAK